jgi:hypothetical protein
MAGPNTRHKLATVTRACQVLKLFADDRQDMTLAEIVVVTGLEKTIAFRIIHTLESEGPSSTQPQREGVCAAGGGNLGQRFQISLPRTGNQ